MTNKNADEIAVGANGTLWLADVGAAEPSSISDPMDAGDWTDTGYLSEAGVQISPKMTTKSVRAWQSFYDLRRIVDAREFMLKFTLQQFNDTSLKLSLGGGDIIEDAPGEFRYVPPEAGTIDEKALCVEWVDGDKNYRLFLPRGMNEQAGAFDIVRTKEIGLPIEFGVLGTDGVDPFFLQTDDPGFEVVAGS